MHPTPSPSISALLRVVPAALTLLLIAPAVLSADRESADQAPKTHTLFMGANLTVYSKDGGLLPVRDIQDNAFVAFDAKKRVVVSAQDDRFKLKIDDKLKLTSVHASINKLQFDRAYTPEHDPMTRFNDAARVASYMGSNTDATGSAVHNAEAAKGSADATVDFLKSVHADPQALAPALEIQAHTAGVLAGAQATSDVAQSLNNMDALSPVSNSSLLTSEIAAERYDAIAVSFELSTPRSLENPYVVIFVRYLADKDRPDSANVWVYAERLPAIDEHPRKVYIRRGGFPPGYHIDSYHVHLYDAGTEVATNVSRKSVALTTDEAFEYTVIDYIGSNRDQSKSATKAKTFWPGDLTTRLISEKLSRTLYARVRKDGRAAGIYEDEACTQAVEDQEIAALAPELRFLPALEKGKAVAGILSFRLGR